MEGGEDGLKHRGLRRWVAAFRGMHVSRAWLQTKRDYRTDTHTDGRTPDKLIPMCRYAWQKLTQTGWCSVGAWAGTLKNPTKCL